jgi:hypothetical protein
MEGGNLKSINILLVKLGVIYTFLGDTSLTFSIHLSLWAEKRKRA